MASVLFNGVTPTSLKMGADTVAALYYGAEKVWPAGAYASVGFSGVGALSVEPKATLQRAVAFAGVGQLSAASNGIQSRSVAFAGTSTLSAVGSRLQARSVLFQGVSALAVASATTRSRAVAMTGVGSLAALKTVTRKKAVALAGVGSVAVAPVRIPGGPTIAQKGYGHVYSASNTADLSMSYANVDGGSAPAAGDLVVWFVSAMDTSASPIVNLTGSGWAQGSNYVTSIFAASILAKVVSSGDLSSPPMIVDDPTTGSWAFWVAYTASGITSLSVSAVGAQHTTSAPTNQVVDSSSLNSPDIAITLGMGNSTDDSPSLSISGATADITFQTANNSFQNSNTYESIVIVDATVGGAAITFSKGDDGTNQLASGYVTVS